MNCPFTMHRPLACTRRWTRIDPAGKGRGGSGVDAVRAPGRRAARSAVIGHDQVPTKAPSVMACMRWPSSRIVMVRLARAKAISHLVCSEHGIAVDLAQRRCGRCRACRPGAVAHDQGGEVLREES
jgi:hypothetical protein